MCTWFSNCNSETLFSGFFVFVFALLLLLLFFFQFVLHFQDLVYEKTLEFPSSFICNFFLNAETKVTFCTK